MGCTDTDGSEYMDNYDDLVPDHAPTSVTVTVARETLIGNIIAEGLIDKLMEEKREVLEQFLHEQRGKIVGKKFGF